jgi:hypothetical protein
MIAESAAPTADPKKPEDAVQPLAAASAPVAVAPLPAAKTDEEIWAEITKDEVKDAAPTKDTGEVVSHDFAETSTEAKEDGKTAPSDGADKQEPVAAKGTEPKPAEAPKDKDIWADAPPELRAAHEAEVAAAKKVANDAKANAGRIRKQFEDLKASASRGADTPKVGDTLDQSLADFPEIAKPVKDALAPIAKQLETLTASEQARTAALNDEVVQHVKSQQELLEASHPGWEQELAGPKGKVFYDWLQDQPKRRRDIFETNREHIFDGPGAIELMDAFKSAIAAAENPTPAPPAKPDAGQTQELSAKRAAQLDGTTSPRSPGGPPFVSGIPKEGDPEAIWNAIPDDNADDRFIRRRA